MALEAGFSAEELEDVAPKALRAFAGMNLGFTYGSKNGLASTTRRNAFLSLCVAKSKAAVAAGELTTNAEGFMARLVSRTKKPKQQIV